MERDYKTFMLSSEPKIAGIPVMTGLPLLVLTLMGFITGHIASLFVLGTVLSLIIHFQFGGLSFRKLLALLYWSFPYFLTCFLFREFPDSSHRIYLR